MWLTVDWHLCSRASGQYSHWAAYSHRSPAMVLDNGMADDFALIAGPASVSGTASAEKAKDQKKREWLKVFETLPSQLLNVYGPSKFAKLSDKQVWTELQEPLKSGAVWMSEMCSKDPERRGVGINRFIHALKTFCEYQNDPSVREANKAVLNPKMCAEFYTEIEFILPSLQYCLAPKKQYQKKGAAALRSSGMDEAVLAERKNEQDLDQHAKKTV